MKIAITIIALASSASAFAPSITGVSTAAAVVSRPAQQAQAQAQAQAIVALQAGGDDEEEGFDLNLEEMFDIFDAADADENFDDAIKKVKGDEKKKK